MTVFTFPERMGVGRRKEGEKGGQLSQVCETSHFGIFSTGNGQFPKA